MKNFSITTENGNTYWISRSCAAECAVFKWFDGCWHVLANKRGPGCPNNVGLWNIPSGYLDYNESLEDCAIRETFEETGIHIDVPYLYTVDSRPEHDMRQNVVTVFWTVYNGNDILTSSNSEPNEVEDIRWIPINELNNYEWINEYHRDRIRDIFYNCVSKTEMLFLC